MLHHCIDVAGPFGIATVVSDGVRNSSRLLAVVTGSLDTVDTPDLLFVKGGDPALTVQYTGIDPEQYALRALDGDEASARLKDIFKPWKGLLVYRPEFFRRMLGQLGLPSIPTLSVPAFLMSGIPETGPEDAGSASAWQCWLDGWSATATEPSFKFLCQEYQLDRMFTDRPVWQAQWLRLRELVRMVY